MSNLSSGDMSSASGWQRNAWPAYLEAMRVRMPAQAARVPPIPYAAPVAWPGPMLLVTLASGVSPGGMSSA